MEENIQTVLFCAFTQNDPNCSICARDADLGTILMTYKGGFVRLIVIGDKYLLGAEEFKPIIYVWALDKKDPKLRIACRGIISSLTLSPSENYLLASIEEKIYIWTLPFGNLNLVLVNHISRITCLKFSLAGPNFISADEHGYIAVWSLPKILSKPPQFTQNPSLEFTRHSSKITCVELTRDFAISASTDCTIKIWELTKGEIKMDILLDVPAASMAINRGGFEIYAGLMDGTIKKILKNGHVFNEFEVLTGSSVNFLELSKGGTLIATSVDGEIKIFQTETGICRKTLSFKSKLSTVVVKEMKKGWAESSNSKLVVELFPVLKFELATKEDRDIVALKLGSKKSLWDGEQCEEKLIDSSNVGTIRPNDIWTTANLNKNLYKFMIDRILNQ